VGGFSCFCDTRVKYIHKCIVEYIVIVGASCPGIGGLHVYIRFIVEYIVVGGASCPGIGGLITFINHILKYFDSKLTSYP
jgi:hypothetical protein